MITLGEGFDLCMKIFPIAQSVILTNSKKKMYEKMDQMETKSINDLDEKIIKSAGSGPKGPKLSLPSGWEEGETVPELGHRYWTGYHAAVDSLPENATASEVKHVLSKIEKNARAFPCPSCRENASKILDENPLVNETIQTKQDGQKALCNFHNHVSEHVGNKTVNCDRTYASNS